MRPFTILSLAAIALGQSGLAFAGLAVATPAPVIGLFAGPWGLVAAAAGYGAYRACKSLR